MMTLPKSLVNQLQSHAVRIDVPDVDTLVLRRVPVRVDLFNKPMTNLLIKRPGPGMPFLAMVNESLAYVGDDPQVKNAFTGQAARQGWRPLVLEAAADGDLGIVLQNALNVLGFGIPPISQSTSPTLLARFGKPLSIPTDSPATIGRDDQITQVIASLHRREPCMPLISGAAGSGKTNLVHGIARKLAGHPVLGNLIELNLLEVFSTTNDTGRMRCLRELLAEVVETHVVAVIEDAELIIGCVDWGQRLLARALEEGARLIGTTLPEHCQVFCCPELARRIQIIALPELSSDSLARILLNARSRYPVEIHEGAALACIRAARDLPGHFPGNALSLLDAAASLAVASGGELVAADDIYSTAHRFPPLAELQNDE